VRVVSAMVGWMWGSRRKISTRKTSSSSSRIQNFLLHTNSPASEIAHDSGIFERK
jgi:hypothetical protein